MEQLNRVQLRGMVGNATSSTIADTRVVRFSLATNYAYKDRQGNAVVETTCHNVIAYDIPKNNLDCIVKGANVEVVGRIRTRTYHAADDSPRTITEILANEVKAIDKQ